MKRLNVFIVLILTVSSGSSYCQTIGASDKIESQKLKEYLSVIASDAMEGRDTPSRGLDSAARYIAGHLSQWGVKPAGDDGTFFQNIPLIAKHLNVEQSFVDVNGERLSYGDYLFRRIVLPGEVSGNVVYVQHGCIIKSKKWNPYQGIDIKDKIIICALSPVNLSQDDFIGIRGADFEYPRDYAARCGAKAIICIPIFKSLVSWNQFMTAYIQKGQSIYEGVKPENTIPILVASPRLLDLLLSGEKRSASDLLAGVMTGNYGESFELSKDKKVTIKTVLMLNPTKTQNVVGVLEGSDPILKKEYVAIGAHYDHLGIGFPVNGDSIYNGADDNGSGTVSVLAIAEAFAKGPKPKRSILFVWHSGEEKDLWGSKHFVDHPKVPLNQIVTYLNIDMIGRSKKSSDSSEATRSLSGSNELYVIGSKMLSTELGELSEHVNKSFLNLTFNYKYDDLAADPYKLIFNSDQYNYVLKGIPIVFYYDGMHEDLHQPSDSVDKIDFMRMEKIVRTIYATAWEIAENAKRPKVDKTLPDELNK
jgi:hypothetical protein